MFAEPFHEGIVRLYSSFEVISGSQFNMEIDFLNFLDGSKILALTDCIDNIKMCGGFS